MQVNNNVQSPQFGMALKINKGAEEGLKNLPLETIKDLQNAGKYLKDTQFYHVKIDKDLSASITADKDAYWGPFTIEKKVTAETGTREIKRYLGEDDGYYGPPSENRTYYEYYPDPEILDLTAWYSHFPFATIYREFPRGETQPTFKTYYMDTFLANKVEDIPLLAKCAKILDSGSVEKYNENAAKLAEKANVSKAVEDLLDTFG